MSAERERNLPRQTDAFLQGCIFAGKADFTDYACARQTFSPVFCLRASRPNERLTILQPANQIKVRFA